MLVIVPAIVVLVAYLIGAIPFGYLVVKIVRGEDIRQFGSGNIGATNVGRLLGWPGFAAVFALDFAKGAGPVALTHWLVNSFESVTLPELLQGDGLAVAAGLAAIIGHMWPVYLKFRGGKGVATGAGAMLALAPLPTAFAAAVWVTLAVVTRYVSLSSITAALALCLARLAQTWPASFAAYNLMLTLFCVAGAVLIIVRHHDNLGRLWRGLEPKIGRQRYAVQESFPTEPHS